MAGACRSHWCTHNPLASAMCKIWDARHLNPLTFLQVINNINFYYQANRVGDLPQSTLNAVPWVKSSLLQEATAGPLGRDMSGGWLTGGAAYATKATIPTAFAVSMMAWSLLR